MDENEPITILTTNGNATMYILKNEFKWVSRWMKWKNIDCLFENKMKIKCLFPLVLFVTISVHMNQERQVNNEQSYCDIIIAYAILNL